MNIFFRVQDLGIIRDIFLYKIYPVNLINLKKDNDLIIDIGAHIGCFSLLANKLTNKEVIAIEPEEENFKLLTKNILLNKAKIMPVKCAISNYNKTKKFYKSFSTLSHSLRKISETFEYVKVMKLKTLLKKMKITLNDIKLIKLDAEGEELRIIRDSKNILSKKPILFIDVIEISRKERESMYKLLKKMNFSVLFFKKAGIYLAL
jgi:FkbM family methyltransferase